MPAKNIFVLNLRKFIKTINTFPFASHPEFNFLLRDITNYVYDAYEYILDLPDEIEKLNPSKRKKLKEDLEKLLPQVTALMDLLCSLDFDSKEMDRTQYILGTMEEEIPEVITLLS